LLLTNNLVLSVENATTWSPGLPRVLVCFGRARSQSWIGPPSCTPAAKVRPSGEKASEEALGRPAITYSVLATRFHRVKRPSFAKVEINASRVPWRCATWFYRTHPAAHGTGLDQESVRRRANWKARLTCLPSNRDSALVSAGSKVLKTSPP